VWEDHLLPLLTCKDAGRLGCTCKALRGVVRQHFKDLGTINLDKLQAALTTFPRARSVALHGWGSWVTDSLPLWQWLRDVGMGRNLERVTSVGEAAFYLVYMALRSIALPSLMSADVDLDDEAARNLRSHARANGDRQLR
jgi:hypothetical protein